MMRFQRAQVATLGERLAEDPHRLIALFGPRQTGKTTIVRQALEAIHPRCQRYIAVDDPLDAAPDDLFAPAGRSSLVAPAATLSPSRRRDTDWLVERWREARHEADEQGRFVLVLDEIQKIPEWSEVVKGLWDADRRHDRPLHVVLLGSAPLLMQSGLTESLAGRFELASVSHWTLPEVAEAFGFDLDQYLYFGAYPGAAPYVPDAERWRGYVVHSIVAPNIERDILALTRVDKPVLLRRLFELGTDYSGQILSYNKMLGQLQDAGNTTTLARYLHLLSGAGLIAGIPQYSTKPYRVRASSPKLCVLNTALMTCNSGYSFDEARADRTFWGRVVESAVGAHLVNTASPDIHVHYWRDGPHEVDFVLRNGPRVIAIEVKSGARRSRRLPGVERFQQRFAPHRTLLVGDGGVSLREFLTFPARHWFDEQ